MGADFPLKGLLNLAEPLLAERCNYRPMKVNILDLIDFKKVDTLLEGFNKSTGFVTAILDLNGNVLSKSGWRQICTEFHRINPETSKKCTISDTVLAGKMAEGEQYHFYKCLNGLVDVAVPVVINGEHIANLFSGQFFFEEPDRMIFKKQAEEFGFSEEKYLEALAKVPVISRERVVVAMDFLLNMTKLISEMTFQKLEQMELTAQFQQAQKMESVGRLAGGVAHDYNNMLGVILGFTELAIEKVNPSEPLHADLMEILAAAKRSTAITRQLLAFARKQTIEPKVLDINETVDSMLKMLRRLIGEDIDLAWMPESNMWSIKIDPAQVEQILANLCVNARDAIGGVGKVTIETHTITFDDAYCAEHTGFVPGNFVLLAVSDDGCGMDEETRENIFEPFFTTKELNQGTGLGLATVYGIVKQNNGFINVYSEPGKGTTFRIYLPRHKGQAKKTREQATAEILASRGERVLLVEDETAIRKMAQKMLERLGYQVLTAAAPGEALRLAEEHRNGIQLLITDVVMPEMNGRDLANQLQNQYPDIKILYMSGYTANVIAHRGVLDEGVQFIQKPFSKTDLGIKVRAILDQK